MGNEEQEQKFTSASDYFKRFGQRFKTVTLPSGEIFQIRKLQLLDFIGQAMIPSGLLQESDLEGWEQKSEKERVDVLAKHRTPETDLALNTNLLVSGVVKPKLVDSEKFDIEKGEIGLSIVDTLDQMILINEILDFSGLTSKYRESTRPFCREERNDS